jgi:mono/diheme cytochrome c family protein
MRKRKWSGVAAAAALVGFVACGGDAGETADAPVQTGAQPPAAGVDIGANVELPEGVTQEMVAQGKTVFETSTCWTCHGMDGAGGPLAPSLRDGEWLNTDGTYEGIINVVRTGVAQPVSAPAPMPAMGGAQLTDDQVNQVAAYVYALSHGG